MSYHDDLDRVYRRATRALTVLLWFLGGMLALSLVGFACFLYDGIVGF